MRLVRWLPIALTVLLPACESSPSSAPPSVALTTPSTQASANQQNWDKIVAAAKQEGKVTVVMPPGDATRSALTDPFEKIYGISVDAQAMSGSQSTGRIVSERTAGKYLEDVFVNGVTEVLTTLIPGRAVDPVEPALQPDVKDPKIWRDGGIEWLDKDHSLLVSTRTVYPTLWVNPSKVKPESIKSFKDFLDPSWKGKLVLDDPRRPGPGQALLTEWYLTPDLGADYIRSFAQQQPLILTDYNQEANMIGQAQYSVLLGGSDQTMAPLIKKGVPIAVVPPQQLKEPPQVAAGATGVALFNKAPHPNAAQVYLNWLLSKDGQTSFAKSQAAASNRLDVPTDYLESWRVPTAGAIKTYGPDVLAVRDKVNALAKETF